MIHWTCFLAPPPMQFSFSVWMWSDWSGNLWRNNLALETHSLYSSDKLFSPLSTLASNLHHQSLLCLITVMTLYGDDRRVFCSRRLSHRSDKIGHCVSCVKVCWCGRSSQRGGFRLRTGPIKRWWRKSHRATGCTAHTRPQQESTTLCSNVGLR